MEENLSRAMFYLEKELGIMIGEDYPLLKFYSQLDYLVELKEREQKEMNKSKKRFRR